jgi:hypothetical protein
MSDVADRFYDEVRQIKSMLMRDLGKWEAEAEELLNGFLAKHAALLAARIKAHTTAIPDGSAEDYARQHADLIYREGADR